MMTFRLFSFGLVWMLVLLTPGYFTLAETPYAADRIVSRGASPEVSFLLRSDAAKKTLTIRIAVENLRADWPAPRVHLGLAARKALTLENKDGTVSESGGRRFYDFTVKTARLGSDAVPENFRWAFDVGWINPAGEAIQKENFLMKSGTPVFAPIGKDPERWQPFSLAEHARLVAQRQEQIRIGWEQPGDGVASVVVENADGVRVRNLVSGRRFSAGAQSVVWDGLDEEGRLVAPGEYRWRAVTHPGIRPKFLMSYYSPGKPGWFAGPTSRWLGDHSPPLCAASNGESIAIGCPIAESGNNIVLVDPEGNKFQDGNLSSFIGSGNLFLAMDGERFYAFAEGVPHYEKIRKDEKGEEFLYGSLSFVAWNIRDGSRFRYEGTGKNGDRIVREYRLDPALKIKHGGVHNLRGVAAINGALYVSLHDEDKILVIDPETGNITGEMALPHPGALASDGTRLLAFSDEKLVLFEKPGAGAAAKRLFTPALSQPRPRQGEKPVAAALALRADGRIFVADNGTDQNIKVYDPEGKPLFTIGRKGGGVEEGKWVPDAVRLPTGLALDGRGQLWVAENHAAPKRVSVWNSEDGHLVRELFGPAHYGASGAGFDTQDLTRWVGGASLWKLDIDRNTAQIESVLFSGDKKGMPSLRFYPFSAWFLHREGRTFLISKDNVMRLYEILPEGRAKLWAMLGPLHAYQAEHPRWWVPEVFTRHPDLKAILADFTQPVGPYENFRNAPAASKEGRDRSILWIDRNGDDQAQLEELQVAGDEDHQMRSTIWGYHYEDTLDWKLMVLLGEGKTGVGELRFKGWLPSGAPDWDLRDAVMNAQPVEGVHSRSPQSFAQDRMGRFLINGHPMIGVGPEGKVQWSYPNDWTGVHGSHRAPLPETGVLQGSLSYLGIAPFDKEGDVTIINGNHGRFFVMTTDGIYLDEMFQDVRLSRDASPYRIGGECFGGYFGRDQKSGRYILQSGHSDYRIFEILGLDQAKRQGGTLEVTSEQVAAAQRMMERKVAEASHVRNAEIAQRTDATPPPVATAEWGNAAARFPHARVTAWREGEALVLKYEVKDPSPWVNHGTDRQLLFKSGDSVVFEFSTDPKAAARRSEPAPGDKRLLLAPFEEKPVAVLYDYRIPGTKDPVPFNSPWRTATVDRVRLLEKAEIEVTRRRDGYTLVARLPLAELGLPASGPAALKGDFGIIYGDEAGTMNILRSYWSNQSTGLVNDVPGETMINPSLWGNLEWK